MQKKIAYRTKKTEYNINIEIKRKKVLHKKKKGGIICMR